jgi:uncharacterized membrane protein
MSNLVVLGFDGIPTVDEVLNRLRSLQREYLIDVQGSRVIERGEGGKNHIKQAVNRMAAGAAAGGVRGALWGALVGILFLNPLAGTAIGGVTGASAEYLALKHTRSDAEDSIEQVRLAAAQAALVATPISKTYRRGLTLVGR